MRFLLQIHPHTSTHTHIGDDGTGRSVYRIRDAPNQNNWNATGINIKASKSMARSVTDGVLFQHLV